MSEPFVGEIRMFAGNFAPRGWAFCDGQLLAVSQNDALFSLLGTIYGGDGRTTFGLPDLRGRLPIHAGTGPGLSPRSLGQKFGTEHETITTNTLPQHTHDYNSVTVAATEATPTGNVVASPAFNLYQKNLAPNSNNMSPSAVGTTGGSQSHTNIQPFLCLHFIVSLFGIYPSRH